MADKVAGFVGFCWLVLFVFVVMWIGGCASAGPIVCNDTGHVECHAVHAP